MTHRPSLFSRRAKRGQLLPVHTPPPTTTDLRPTTLPASPRRYRRTHSPKAIPSSLQPMQARPPEQPQPILPSQTTPTELKPRSRFTNNCNACASSSSHSPLHLNSLYLLSTRKKGAARRH